MRIQDLPNQHPFLDEVREGMRVIPAQAHQLPSDADLASVEALLGWPLPAPYRNFISKFGGVYLEVKEEIWPAPTVGTVGPYWQAAMYGSKLFGVAKDIPEFLDVRRALSGFRRRMPDRTDLLPVFQWAGGGNFVTCINRQGTLFDVDLLARDVRPIESAFDVFVVEQARTMKDYMNQMAAIRGMG